MPKLSPLQRVALETAAGAHPDKRPFGVQILFRDGTTLFNSLEGLDDDETERSVEAIPGDDLADERTAADHKIIAVLQEASKPLKSTVIARKAGLSSNGSHFRLALARLRKAKTIFRPDDTESAYWLSGKELPQKTERSV